MVALPDSEPAVLDDDVQVDAPFARDLPDLNSDPAFDGTAFLSGLGEAGRNSGGGLGLPPHTQKHNTTHHHPTLKEFESREAP